MIALEPVAKQKKNNNFAITSLADGRTLSGGPGEANDEIQAMIAAGRVDTVYAEQFRVGKMPKEIPDGFWKMSTIFQVSAEGDAIQYNYVLPEECGVYHVYIFDWGTGRGYSQCN